MKSTKPKTHKENLRVMRIEFEVSTVLKNECFTRTGRLRRNKQLRKGIADTLRYEGHRFLEAHSTEDILKYATIKIEEVEVEDEDQS